MDLFDLYQSRRISEHKSEQRKTNEATQSEIAALHERVEYLSLVCIAMSELMEGLGIDQQALVAKIEEVDLRDGQRDGKFVEIFTCTSCSRRTTAKKSICMYCGASLTKSSAI